MENRIALKAACMTLASLLLIGAALSPYLAWGADAMNPSEKDETVYVYANADGSVKGVEVSTMLLNPSGASSLADATNLTGIKGENDKTFEGSGGAITWNADGENVTYKGETSSPVPIRIRASYSLDDQPISAEEVAGKSGRVTIRYEFANESTATAVVNGVEQHIYTPFTCITAMMLDGNNFKNVSVENAKVVNDGGDMIIAGYAMPGLKQSLGPMADDADIPEYFTVSADVVDFKLKSTMTIATAGLMSDFDSDSLGMSNLDGAGALTDAMGQLISGSGELSKGLDTLEDGIKQLEQGTGGIADGTTLLSAGIAALAGEDGLSGLAAGASSLPEALTMVGSHVSDASSQLSQTSTTLGTIATSVAYDEAIAVLESHKDEIVKEGAMSEEEYLQVMTALKGGVASSEAIQETADGLLEASKGMGALAGQVNALAEQAGYLAAALSVAADSAYELAEGAESLEGYAHQLDNAMPTLAEGAHAAAQGSHALTEGMQTFNDEGVSRLVSAIENDYGGFLDRISGLSDAAKSYTNFGGITPGTKGNVKFVYELDAIDKE